MKILNICGYTWAIGGPARIIHDHAVVQIQQGHEVTILTPVWQGEKTYPAPDGVRVVAVNVIGLLAFFLNFRWMHGSGYAKITRTSI